MSEAVSPAPEESEWNRRIDAMLPLERLLFTATVRYQSYIRYYKRKIKAVIQKRNVQLNTRMDALIAVAEIWNELQAAQLAKLKASQRAKPRIVSSSYATALKHARK